MAGGMKNMVVITMAAVFAAASFNANWVAAEEHHVAGGDRGWATSTDLASWAADKIFRVGDNIWFAYSAAQEGIVELSNKEDFESCNLENPIKMYTDGIDRVSLDEEGTRYFASNRPESCQSGLKLHVNVLPKDHPAMPTVLAASEAEAINAEVDSTFAATAPTTPSASTRLAGLSTLLVAVLAAGLCSWAF